MRTLHFKTMALVGLIITGVAPGTLLATQLVLVNGGFEEPILNAGEEQPFPFYGPPDRYPDAAGGGWFSVRGGTTIIHPDEELFSNGAAEGNNAARLSAVHGQNSIYQVIEDLQPESRYHVQVDVGNSLTETFNVSGGAPFLYRIGLSLRARSGGSFYPLADASDVIFPSDGEWGTVDLWYDSPDQTWIDENWLMSTYVLVLSIDARGVFQNRNAVYVDNVRLSITPVPETSTLALTSIGVGILALLVYRRCRRPDLRATVCQRTRSVSAFTVPQNTMALPKGA